MKNSVCIKEVLKTLLVIFAKILNLNFPYVKVQLLFFEFFPKKKYAHFYLV